MSRQWLRTHGRIQKGGQGPGPPPPENHTYCSIGFICNTGADPLKNHKATKPAFNVVPLSAHQRNAMAFRWRADDGLWILYSPFS